MNVPLLTVVLASDTKLAGRVYDGTARGEASRNDSSLSQERLAAIYSSMRCSYEATDRVLRAAGVEHTTHCLYDDSRGHGLARGAHP